MASPLLILLAVLTYAAYRLIRPFLSLYAHLRRARNVGLPIKVLPVPQGLFSFFALQILRRLHLVRPGTTLHKMLNMGRPDGYDLHKEMGDMFLTVNPSGISLVVADPKVISHVSGRRAEFPKPPNTGAIINIYGRNVINADGDIWRFHRRVTGPVFSERIHGAVWDEGKKQAELMMRSWSFSPTTASVRVNTLGDDALRLGLHVITGAAYGCPLGWDESPPTTSTQTLSYRGSVEQLTAHLMPVFLTPRWLLRLAPSGTTWGRAWAAYEAFGGYMRGMLERERRLRFGDVEGREDAENLLTALIRAQEEGDEKEGRTMSNEEVMGNAFIFLFAGHETTANTLHYALILLALHPEVQALLLDEIDTIYENAAREGRTELEYDWDFSRSRWAIAVMSETLRIYTPTGMVNKWTATDQALSFEGRTYVIPRETRIAINGTGVHSNPKVWGDDAGVWRPARWIVEGDVGSSSEGSRPMTPVLAPAERVPFNGKAVDSRLLIESKNSLLTPPPTPTPSVISPPLGPSYFVSRARLPTRDPSPTPSTDSTSSVSSNISDSSTISTTPSLMSSTSACSTSSTSINVLKPPKGSFLPFSEGSRACSGKKFATVEFVSVVFTLLREHRVELVSDEGWDEPRVRKVLAGRKAGALTLQPPEAVPLRFVRRTL